MLICRYIRLGDRDGYRACSFVVSGGLAPRSGLLFSHPMPVGIGYWFLSCPVPLGIRGFAHCWDRDFRDHGGSWDIRTVLDC